MGVVHIVILGASFAGLAAAGECRRRFGDRARITVVDRSAIFWFRPGLPLLVAGKVPLGELGVPLEPLLARAGIRRLQAEVVGLRPEANKVETSRGPLPYDYLVIALGGSSPPAEPAGLSRLGHAPIWPRSALALRRELARFPGGKAVMVLCPFTPLPGPGYELLLEVARALRGRAGLTLITWEEQPFAFAGPRAGRVVAGRLAREGIRFLGRAVVREAEPGILHLADGRRIPSDLTLYLPPFAGPLPARRLPGFTDEAGFIPVDRSLRTPLHPNVFAAGDAAAFPGPKSGLAAELQGRAAARNIAREFGLHPGEDYRHGFISLTNLAGRGLLAACLPGGSSRPFLALQGFSPVWAKRVFQRYFLTVGLPLRLRGRDFLRPGSRFP